MNHRFYLKPLLIAFGVLFLSSPALADTACDYQGKLVVTDTGYVPLLGGLTELGKYPQCHLKEIVDNLSWKFLVELMPHGGIFCFTVIHEDEGTKQMYAAPGACNSGNGRHLPLDKDSKRFLPNPGI